MSRNVLQCVKESSERFLLALSVGVRHPEQILNDVADLQCGFVCLDYGIYSADKVGGVAGNVVYVFTFSVLSVCVNRTN